MSPEKQLVERLHKVLVEEIRLRRPQYLREPFTVAEIYQDLVPYRSHRDRIGAAMNGDYEHALLELLAGQGGFLTLESDQARKRLMDELGSPDPNTGIFREYAALDVRLNPARIPTPVEPPPSSARPAAEPQGRGGVETVATSASGTPAAGTAAAKGPPASAMAPAPERRPAAAARSPSVPMDSPRASEGAPSNCRWCSRDLPHREKLRFCPFCGVDVNLVPCPSCGEELESGWRFCIACGSQVDADA